MDALRCPDILALQEVQDSSGPSNDGTVAAERSYRTLTGAIAALPGGVPYAWCEIPPKDNQDGGMEGANIRVAVLHNPERVRLLDQPGVGPVLIQPDHPTFRGSRKPLVVRLEFRGHSLHVVVLHLTSRLGDAEDFGRIQPPVSRSSDLRARQAELVAGYIRDLARREPDSDVVVLGDLNDDASSPAAQALLGAGLVDLASYLLEPAERYTYIYRGRAQEMDHILVSRSLAEAADPRMWILHRYAEYPSTGRATDHDPVLAALELRDGR